MRPECRILAAASSISKSSPIADVAKLIEDTRPAVRDRAIEFLVQAGAAAVPALASLRGSSKHDEARTAAVFALYRINTPEARAAVRAALNDSSFSARIAAARCAGMSHDSEAVPRLTEIAKADHPAARRQAIAALGQIGDVRALPALVAAAANPEDRFVEHSTIFSLITLNQPAALQKELTSANPKVRKAALIAMDQLDSSPLRREQIAPLLRTPDKELRSAALWVASRHPDWAEVVLAYLGERLRDPSTPPEELESVRDALVAFSENKSAQEFVAKTLADSALGEKQVIFMLDTIEGIRLKELPASWTSALSKLIDSPRANVRTRTVELIRSRAIPGFNEQLQAIAADPKTPDQLRVTVLDILVARRSNLTSDQYAFLTSRLSPQSDAVMRQTAARIIGRSTPDRQQLLQIAREHLPKADPLTLSTILDCFRTSKDEEVGKALIAVLQKSSSALSTLGEDRLKALLAGYGPSVQESSKPLFDHLKKAQQERIARLEKLEPLLTAGGDVGRGRRLFFGEKVACSSCHTIGTEGRKVGPDLTGIGAIRSGHDLLEAIVFPSASFVPGHEVFNVDTETERLSGVIKSQSKEAVVLITGPDGEVRIPRSIVKSVTPSTVSLMPEGFDEQLSKSELTDLLAFLQAERTRPKTMAASSSGL